MQFLEKIRRITERIAVFSNCIMGFQIGIRMIKRMGNK